MADPTGRPNDYDDVLTLMHNGAWFGFYKDADYSTGIAAPHVYENLDRLKEFASSQFDGAPVKTIICARVPFGV